MRDSLDIIQSIDSQKYLKNDEYSNNTNNHRKFNEYYLLSFEKLRVVGDGLLSLRLVKLSDVLLDIDTHRMNRYWHETNEDIIIKRSRF